MSTNYYYRFNLCDCCGRFDEEHVGLAVAWGTFWFQGSKEIRSFQDWLDFFETHPGQLFDQYGDPVELDEFKQLVEKGRGKPSDLDFGEWMDGEGNLFSDRTFS